MDKIQTDDLRVIEEKLRLGRGAANSMFNSHSGLNRVNSVNEYVYGDSYNGGRIYLCDTVLLKQ